MNTRSTSNPSYEGTRRYFWSRADNYQGPPSDRKGRRWVVMDAWTGQPASWHASRLEAQQQTRALNRVSIELGESLKELPA